jgi:ABC-type transporter Mla MlaB component
MAGPDTDSAILHGAVLALTLTTSGVAVAGDLDASNRAELARVLDELSNRVGDIDLDLSHVDFADVATALLFVSTARRIGPGRAFLLRRPPVQVVSMIRLFSDVACPGPATSGVRQDIRIEA